MLIAYLTLIRDPFLQVDYMNNLVFSTEEYNLVPCPYRDCKRFVLNTARYAFRTRPFRSGAVHHEFTHEKQTAEYTQLRVPDSTHNASQQWEEQQFYKAIRAPVHEQIPDHVSQTQQQPQG